MNPVALALKSQLNELARRKTGSRRWEDLGDARVILPESSIPWGVAHFVGGAVLGQFPELCYDALLRPLADRAGIAVICTPYELGTDHYTLAQQVGEDFEAALSLGAARYGWPIDTMPRLALGHSLGSKLQVMRCCEADRKVYGLGLLAFNNFGVEDQVRLLRETLKAVRGEGAFDAPDSLWERVLQPAIGRVARLSGMEFKPGPEELLDTVAASFKGVGRVRMFRFEDDNLDCSEDLLEALGDKGAPNVSREILPGGHLTPVVVKLTDVTQAAAQAAASGRMPGGMPGVPPGMADQVGERFGGMAGAASLGDEAELEAALGSLVAWATARS